MSGVEPKTGLRRLTALNAETAAAKSFRPSAAVPCVRWVAAALRRARSWTCCCARATTSCSIASSTDSALIRPARRLSPPCASFDRLRRCCAAIFAFRCSSRSAASSAATRARIRDWCALVVPGGPDRTGPLPQGAAPTAAAAALAAWRRVVVALRGGQTGEGHRVGSPDAARFPSAGARGAGGRRSHRHAHRRRGCATGRRRCRPHAAARRGGAGGGALVCAPSVGVSKTRVGNSLGLGLSAHPLRSRGGRRPAPA